MNKNFDRLALLFKIISQNSKIVSTSFQLNHINKYSQITKIKFDHKLLVIPMLFQPSSYSTDCPKSVWHTKVSGVVVPSDNFHGLLIWLSQEVNILKFYLCFFATSWLFFITFTKSVLKRSSAMFYLQKFL